MKKFLLIFISFLIFTTLSGQTIIDLKPGGGVRAKSAEEYRQTEPGLAEKMKADSLLYNDNLTRALNALYRDSLDTAEKLLNEALRLRPHALSNGIVRQYLGRIAMARGDYRKAISTFTTLLKDFPENRDVRHDRASCYLEIKNTKAALEDCDIILRHELSPEDRIKTLFLRSDCNTKDRHPERAKTDLEEILSLDPKNESALLLLAFAYQHLGQHKEALERMNLFVTSHPQSVDGLVARAELEEKLEMNEIARADYDHALKMAPQQADLYVRRARLLLKLKLPQQAENDIRKAAQLGYPAEALYPLLPNDKE